MTAIRRLLHRIGRAVVDLIGPLWRIGGTWVTRVTRAATRLWSAIRARHDQRMDTDPAYPIALVAGLTAGFGVLVGHPAVAAGIGVIAGELLGVRPTERRTTSPRYSPSRWDEGRPGRPLWDHDWDE